MASVSQERRERLLIDLRDAAQLIGISYSNAWKLANNGELPSVRIGGRKMFSPEAIKAWIAAKSAGGAR